MSRIWKIYLSGCLISICMFAYNLRDEKLGIGEYVITLCMSALSWICVLALWTGLNIKNGHKDLK